MRSMPGRYELSLADGPDPEMSLVVVSDQGADDAALREGAEWCVRRYAEPAEIIRPGEDIPVGKHVNLQLDSPGRKSFFLEVDTQVRIGLYAQHLAEEFDLQLTNEGAVVSPSRSSELGSHSTSTTTRWAQSRSRGMGDVDPAKLNAWLGKLLGERGVDIFRMKGFISLAG